MTTKIQGTTGVEFPDTTVQGSAAYTKSEIIETSSNGNSTSTKFADGTLLWRGGTAFTPAPFTGSANLWYSTATNPFTFPVAFIATPTIQVCCGDSAVAIRGAYVSSVSVTTTGVPQVYLSSPAPTNPGTAGTITLHAIAIGRWK